MSDEDFPEPEVWPGRCSECSRFLWYSVNYDATFCPPCDRWAESACDDPACDFCATRPVRPSAAPDLCPCEHMSEE